MRRSLLLIWAGLVLILMLVVLTINPTPVFAQEAETDDDMPIPAGPVDDSARVEHPLIEKWTYHEGTPNSVDLGDHTVFVPFFSYGSAPDIEGAEVNRTWYTIFEDEMCDFPAGWWTYNYGYTGSYWDMYYVNGRCAAQPNTYSDNMLTYMRINVDLTGAIDGRMAFKWRSDTESYYDYLVYEYSCDGGLIWRTGYGHRLSGDWNGTWYWNNVNLRKCAGYPDVTLSIGFMTDGSVTYPLAPAIDYVRVEKYQ